MLVGVVELWSVWKAAATYIFSTPSPIGVDVEISAACLIPRIVRDSFPMHVRSLWTESAISHYARNFSSAPWMRLTRSAKAGSSRIIADTRSKLWITVE